MSIEIALFMIVGGLAVAAAIGMLLSENAVHSAIFLILNFVCVAFLFLMLDAAFLSMVQIAVYAGAIMVLFLFVIMLLGAEKTTDTTRQFRWLAGVALVLAAAFMLLVGGPLVMSEFQQPETAAEPALLRVVNAVPEHIEGQALQPRPFDLYLGDQLLAAGLEFNTAYPDTTAGQLPYMELEAGYVVLTLLPTGGGTELLVPLALEPGDVQTVVVYQNLEGALSTLTVPESLAQTADRSARLTVINLLTSAPLTLVDLGPGGLLNTRMRNVGAADNVDVVDEAGSPVMEPVIVDPVLAAGLAFGVPSAPLDYGEGQRNLAFVDENLQIVHRLTDYELLRDTTALLLLAGETTFDGGSRPTMIDEVVRANPAYGSPASVGLVLYTDYLLPVQLVAILLLVALIGVVVLSRPEGLQREPRTRRRRVSRPLVSVISSQTGSDVLQDRPRLDRPGGSDAEAEPAGD